MQSRPPQLVRNTTRARAEYDTLAAKRSKNDTVRVRHEGIVNDLNQWLTAKGHWADKGLRHDSDIEPPVAQLRRDESFLDAIRRVQREISDAQTKVLEIKAAPPPGREIRAEIERQLQAMRNSVNFGHTFRTDRNGIERLELVAPDLHSWLIGAGAETNVRGMITQYMMGLFPEQMIELFTRGIDDDAPGVPRADKARLIADAEARVVELELQEMSLVEQAQAQGLDILPRAGMSPLALLGLVPRREAQTLH